MDKTVKVQELAIVIEANNHNPTVLNPDFLKYNEIARKDWELAEDPVCMDHLAVVKYKNGLTVMTQFDKVIFTEAFGDKSIVELTAPAVALKYVQTLRHVNYTAVEVKPEGMIEFGSAEEARRYLADTLVKPGPWLELGQAPVEIALKFSYLLDEVPFDLTVEEIPPGLEEPRLPSGLWFSGEFFHEVKGEGRDERTRSLHHIIENWQTDLMTFIEVVNEKFAAK